MEQSPIFIKTETLLKWLLEHTQKFPKHERFRLAKRVDDTIFAFHEYLLQGVRSRQPLSYLFQADIELDKMRSYLRMAHEFQYIAHGQYAYASQQINEIGRILGGWIKKLGTQQTHSEQV